MTQHNMVVITRFACFGNASFWCLKLEDPGHVTLQINPFCSKMFKCLPQSFCHPEWWLLLYLDVRVKISFNIIECNSLRQFSPVVVWSIILQLQINKKRLWKRSLWNQMKNNQPYPSFFVIVTLLYSPRKPKQRLQAACTMQNTCNQITR